MAVPSLVSISNDALGEIREKPIQSMDEGSFQAVECSRVYPQVLEEMLEGHEWSFGTTRVILASLPNDRPAEWPFAYAMPQSVGRVRRVVPLSSNIGFYSSGRSVGWAVQPNQYEIEAGVLYSMLSAVMLEYVSAYIDPSVMTALFRRALALGMAERLAISLREAGTLQQSIAGRAVIAMSRAMADDMNRQPQSPIEATVGSVRAGGSIHGDWLISYGSSGSLPVAETGLGPVTPTPAPSDEQWDNVQW